MLEKWLKENNYKIERGEGYISVYEEKNGYQISNIQSDLEGRIYVINCYRAIGESMRDFSLRSTQLSRDAIELSELLKND